jgi:hypothetical protein
MRRGKPQSVEKYLKVRLQMLYEERKKNDNELAHMVLDKSIYELHEVLDLVKRVPQSE